MRIGELRGLEREATSGPWVLGGYTNTQSKRNAYVLSEQPEGSGQFSFVVNAETPPDCAFIVAARNHHAALLDVADAAILLNGCIKAHYTHGSDFRGLDAAIARLEAIR